MPTKKSSGFLFSFAILIGLLLGWGGVQVIKSSTGTPQLGLPMSGDIVKNSLQQKAVEQEAPQNPVAPTSLPDEMPLSASEKIKMQTLKQILDSKQDNDPRLDRDFRNLSTRFHQAMRDQYQKLPVEQRNERGTIAFLLTRDLKTVEDLDFVRGVYLEKPCLSLEDCQTRSQSDPHLSGIDQVSMNYPQLITIHQLERQITDHPEKFESSEMRDQLKAALEQAARFPVPAVSTKAEEVLRKIQL